MLAMHGLRKHCGMSLLKLRSRPPLYSLQISHAFSSKPDNNQNNEVKEVTPNLIFYSLYSTLCYCGVYVGTFSSIYMALTKGIITAESFDVDQLESAARVILWHYYYEISTDIFCFCSCNIFLAQRRTWQMAHTCNSLLMPCSLIGT